MKPTKNRIYCPTAGKPKMLFESRCKAEKFMIWNPDLGLTRAYYCEVCGGWHLTSSDRQEYSITQKVDKVIDAYKSRHREKLYHNEYDILMKKPRLYTQEQVMDAILKSNFTSKQIMSLRKAYGIDKEEIDD